MNLMEDIVIYTKDFIKLLYFLSQNRLFKSKEEADREIGKNHRIWIARNKYASVCILKFKT